jgi:hypothetical protein
MGRGGQKKTPKEETVKNIMRKEINKKKGPTPPKYT